MAGEDALTLGKKLYENGQHYERLGYESFGEFAREELGLPQRRAEHYRRIWETFGVKFKHEVDLSNPPPVSKLKILSRFVTKADVAHWWKRSATMTCQDLTKEAAKREPSKFNESDDAFAQRTFYLTEEEERLLNKALKVAAAEGKLTRGGAKLSYILRAFLRGH